MLSKNSFEHHLELQFKIILFSFFLSNSGHMTIRIIGHMITVVGVGSESPWFAEEKVRGRTEAELLKLRIYCSTGLGGPSYLIADIIVLHQSYVGRKAMSCAVSTW